MKVHDGPKLLKFKKAFDDGHMLYIRSKVQFLSSYHLPMLDETFLLNSKRI